MQAKKHNYELGFYSVVGVSVVSLWSSHTVAGLSVRVMTTQLLGRS
jgi:hypothetical protein